MYRKYIKRVLDVLLSLLGMPLLLIVWIVFAPIIYLSDRGPVFYNASRRGRNGKAFKMYKFRSMYVNAPDIRLDDGSTYNATDDPRVTKIGCLLRETSLDEAPQIINVLVGDMSVVGPRPNLVTSSYEQLSQIERKRISVRPGISGYNQAFFRNAVTTEEKYVNDCYYVDNVSFSLDIKIFFCTIASVLLRKNINNRTDIASSTSSEEYLCKH